LNSLGVAKARSALEKGKVAIGMTAFKYRGPRNGVGRIVVSKPTGGNVQHTHDTTKEKQGDVGCVLVRKQHASTIVENTAIVPNLFVLISSSF